MWERRNPYPTRGERKQSDSSIVVMKRANKEGELSAESVDAKGWNQGEFRLTKVRTGPRAGQPCAQAGVGYGGRRNLPSIPGGRSRMPPRFSWRAVRHQWPPDVSGHVRMLRGGRWATGVPTATSCPPASTGRSLGEAAAFPPAGAAELPTRGERKQSDSSIVVTKRANKEGELSAESVERRGGTKGNFGSPKYGPDPEPGNRDTGGGRIRRASQPAVNT